MVLDFAADRKFVAGFENRQVKLGQYYFFLKPFQPVTAPGESNSCQPDEFHFFVALYSIVVVLDRFVQHY